MQKVLVYAETVREARKFYKGVHGMAVGHRTYEQYEEGEECDLAIFKDEEKMKKYKQKGKKDKKGGK